MLSLIMRSEATTVAEYIAGLPEDRRPAIKQIRAVIRKNLPKGYAETMQYGMITYVVPHKLYQAGYHCNPADALPYASLASQKNHMAVYLSSVYMDPRMAQWLRQQYDERGLKLDMGKSCIRFKKLEQLPLDVIGEAIAKIPVADFIMAYEDGLKLSRSKKANAGA